jgi:uncharacterized protein involved in copper resistance
MRLKCSDTILKSITNDTVPPPSKVARLLEAVKQIPYEQKESVNNIISEIERLESSDKYKSEAHAVEAKKLQDFGADLIPNVTKANGEYLTTGYELSRSLLYICEMLDKHYYNSTTK